MPENNENNIPIVNMEVDEEEHDFGELYARRPLTGALNSRRPARRVPFTTLDNNRPRLQRQIAFLERPGAFEVLRSLIHEGLARQQRILQQLDVSQQYQDQQRFLQEQQRHLQQLKETFAFIVKPAPASDDDCTICMDSDTKMDSAYHTTDCHSFHHECLQNWLWELPCCPMCRASEAPLNAKRKNM